MWLQNVVFHTFFSLGRKQNFWIIFKWCILYLSCPFYTPFVDIIMQCNAISVHAFRSVHAYHISYNRTIKSIYEQNICDLVIPSKFELTVIYIHVFMNVLDMQQLVTKKRILYSLINTDCNMFTIFFFKFHHTWLHGQYLHIRNPNTLPFAWWLLWYFWLL